MFCLAAIAGTPRFVPGQILVKPKAGLAETNFVGKLKSHGATRERRLRRLNVHIVAVPEEKAEAILAELRSDPDIEYAERDYLAEAAFVPDDTYVVSGAEWHLAKIQALQAWDTTTGGSNTIVAILDSGINAANPDLAGQVLPGYDFVGNTSYPTDDFGHGTAVAGAVAAAGNNGIGVAGVAYGCRLLPVKVMDSSGFAAYSTIAQGVKYAADQGARVINISIVGSSPSGTLQDAINYAWSNNVIVVAAAGNNADSVPQYPAACSNVVAVSATEPDDSLAWFSSYGSYVTLSAPGDTIWTTQNDTNNPYGAWRGTSLASPVVAGVAALVASANPSLSNTQIISILERTADDLGSPGYDQFFGYGRVNAFRAVSAAGGEPGAVVPEPVVAPSVNISSPADSAEFSPGANVLLAATASASTSTGVVTSVTFFANGVQLASGSVPPFAFNWTPPIQPGSYWLIAVATDDQGICATSAPVVIQVVSADTNAPSVAITSGPPNGARLTLPQVSLAGTATDDVGVSRVEVQINGGPNQTALGTTNWTVQIELAPGVNVVHVRSVDFTGNTSPDLTRTLTYVVFAPLAVQTNGFGTVTPNLNGNLLQIGKAYTVRAAPGPGQAFAGWSGIVSQSPVLNFAMRSNLTLTANFVPSPFPPVQGNYAGLVANTNSVTPANSGYFNLTMTASGVFSGKLLMAGSRYGFRGQFDLEGNAVVTVSRGSQFTPLTLALHVDLTNGTDQVTGSVTDGGWASALAGDRNVFNARWNPAAQAGLRSFILEQADDTAITAGTGSGKISASGTTSVRGKLDDGHVFSAASLLARNGDCPFYLSLSKGGEVVIGWLNFPATPAPTASGTVLWVRSGTNGFAATLRAASVPQ